MSYFQSAQMAAGVPVPSVLDAGDSVPVTAEFVVPAGLTANDVIEMGAIPAGAIPIDGIAAFDDADSGAGITFDWGVMSGTYGDKNAARTIGQDFGTGLTTAQAGGVARVTNKAGLMLAPNAADIGWGFKVGVAAAGLTAGAKIRATLWVRSAPVGMY